MKRTNRHFLVISLLLLVTGFTARAQEKIWTVEECIKYALSQNVQVKKADLTNDRNQLTANQTLANRLPSVNASVGENLSWYKGFDATTGSYGSSKGSNSTNFGMNSSVAVFNGQKLTNKIKQAQLDLESGKYYSQSVKESLGLNIMNAYLQVLYSVESVTNAEKQIESTTQQLTLAKERLDLGAIAMSDYLQIKSELANEKSTLATAQSQLAMNKVNLMQYMDLPVNNNFKITSPNLDSLLVKSENPDAQAVYNLALGIKPQIKNAELNKQSAELDVKIAQADVLPTISMSGGLSTGYSSLNSETYNAQLKNKVNPTIGLSMSIPIFQKKQLKTNISMAKIGIDDAELDVINTKNTLRKEIEQACVDVETAKTAFAASQEQMQSSKEAYDVTDQKFQVGMLNSADFLIQKTNLITSESKLLQSKFKLIFSYKILDFYKGIPLAL